MSQTKAQLLGSPILGDLSFDNGTLTIDSVNNRIGILTTSPLEILHLDGLSNKQIRLDSSTDVPSYFGVYNDLCNISVNRKPSDGTIIKTDRGSSYITLASSGPDTSYIAFATTSVANTQPSTKLYIAGTGHITPGTDATQDLGSTTKRWANIYSADLQLSNEGSHNDVDGTWGQYTIQEGENDLFLINRRNGKKYKFVLQEVQ
jgi:hypothetical protein